MRKLIDEKVLWWESWLMRKLIDEKVDWEGSWLMRKLIDEKVDWWESWLVTFDDSWWVDFRFWWHMHTRTDNASY